MQCQRCAGQEFSNAGHDRTGRQVFSCTTCARRQIERSASAFAGYRFPDDVRRFTDW